MFVTFYIDRAERTCRTQVFASTATDTAFRIDNRDHYGLVLLYGGDGRGTEPFV